MYMVSSEVPIKKMKMERFNLFVIIVAILHTLSWFCVISSSRMPYLPYYASSVQQPTGTKQYPKTLETNYLSSEKEGVMKNKLIGSMPPKCEHKCYGCTPCQATQVPTTKAHVEIQFANYKPEGWKCKCGPLFYTP